ncbi:trypsin-like peptidase domain-containing protein [Streptomyces sp. NRRL F-5123]|uniref:VMAP-C domain-containing protein n=1 Tax=Streptomyces sp. NRRL F-5123 TaxID=1463856 RepID=UPI0005B9A8FE|nr:trypsin-like peptidase domain-containing protein [Streptomyces sp. NRRL F-5123]
MTPHSGDSDPSDDADPADYLVPLARRATVRIHGAGAGHPLYGSGFFVAPQWVLTCAHVVSRAPGEPAGPDGAPEEAAAAGEPVEAAEAKVTVGWGDRMLDGVVEWAEPAVWEGRGAWPAPDLALVRLLDPVDHPCVYLSERTPRTYPASLVAYLGYTELTGDVEAFDGRCTVRGQLGSMLRLGDDEIPHGVSGGPVLDLVRGEVIGVVKAQRTAHQDGGLAVPVQQLRRLPGAERGPAADRHQREPAADLYQRVTSAHDLYHADRHNSVNRSVDTWTDVHSEIDACAGRALTPGLRTKLLGLLAQLPPPTDAETLRKIVEDSRGTSFEVDLAPRSWRDGLGLLYELRRGTTEMKAVLRYAVLAATADRLGDLDDPAEPAVWEWAEGHAGEAALDRVFRYALGEERRARAGSRGSTGVDLTPEQWNGPEAILQLFPDGWAPGRFDWRVTVMHPEGRVQVVEEGFRTELAALPGALRQPLREAFRRCDSARVLAPLQLAVPGDFIPLAAADWPFGPGGGTLTPDRPVVIRRTDVPAEDDEQAARRAARWGALATQRPRPDVLDCDEGVPSELPDEDALRARPNDTLPVLCRSADTAHDALNRVFLSGYGVALWRHEPVGEDMLCADFHRGVAHTVRVARTAGRLPAALADLRAKVARKVPESYWATGLTMLCTDPTRPLPGADDLLEAP